MTSTFLDNKTWRYFWHPVCTMHELEASDTGRGILLQTKLLGTELVIAKLESVVIAMNNRCPHRSAKLHLGWNCGDSIQCPYHGWKYGADGVCVEIPALPNEPIPPNAKTTTYDCEVKYELVWVRLDGSAGTEIPRHDAYNDLEFKCVLGQSYNWKTHSARRVENYTDLAHFPFIHPKTLGSEEHTTFLAPDIDFRRDGQMKFSYKPSEGSRSGVNSQGELTALKFSDYIINLPFGVNVDLTLQDGSRTVLWIWATPLDDTYCRSFWFVCRNRDQDGPDQPHIDQQMRILEEDIDVVESQDPEQIPHPRDEIAVSSDKVSLTYRRILYELCKAKSEGPEAIKAYMNTERNNI